MNPAMLASGSGPSHALIFAWHKEVRVRLIADRLAIDANDRRQHSVKIALHLSHFIEPPFERTVSFYWPFRGEEAIVTERGILKPRSERKPEE